MSIKVKLLNKNSKIPTKGSNFAAGYDLYACIDKEYIEIQPHCTHKIGTGVAITPPQGCFGALFARSGLATKQGLRPANCVGVCDEDYTGEYIVAIHNDTDVSQRIYNADRIAQVVFLPYQKNEEIEIVGELDSTDRGDSGFGSTGR